MSAKAVLVLCAQALLIQTAFSQCIGSGINYVNNVAAASGLAGVGLISDGLAYNGLAGAGLGLAGNALACGGAYNSAYGLAGVANAPGIAPASGGGLPISSASPIAPTGISVTSENAIEGLLAVTGSLPFVSAVALEGVVPTGGSGSVTYGCGNSNIGIVSEGVAGSVGLANELAYGPVVAGVGGVGSLAAPAFGAGLGIGGLAAPAFGAGLGFGGLAAPAFGGCGCGGIY